MENNQNNHIVDTNKKVSSVEWLIEQFRNTIGDSIIKVMGKEIQQAKAMHKDEIINTYQHGFKAGIGVAVDIEKGNDSSDLTPDEFYKQTYGHD